MLYILFKIIIIKTTNFIIHKKIITRLHYKCILNKFNQNIHFHFIKGSKGLLKIGLGIGSEILIF